MALFVVSKISTQKRTSNFDPNRLKNISAAAGSEAMAANRENNFRGSQGDFAKHRDDAVEGIFGPGGKLIPNPGQPHLVAGQQPRYLPKTKCKASRPFFENCFALTCWI